MKYDAYMKSRESDFFKYNNAKKKFHSASFKNYNKYCFGICCRKTAKRDSVIFQSWALQILCDKSFKDNVELSNTVFSPLCQFTNTWCLHNLTCNDFQAFGVALVKSMTAATAAITLACLFIEMPCYVLGRLHSCCMLNTNIGL